MPFSHIYYDHRWIGSHGIGRFANELDKGFSFQRLPIDSSPSSPVDPIRLLYAMLLHIPKVNCVFSPGYNAPLFVVCPYVFTIHDLNHIDRLENKSFFKDIYYHFVMRRACHKAFRILTVSEFSRKRIIDWAGVEPSRVINVGNGVDESYHPDVQPYAPGYDYLLCVSNRKAHKNEPRVLEAFARADIDPAIHLIFTGLANETLLNLCRHYGVEERVVFVGRIPENDLPSLYRGAVALVFPSLYEGFGLPVIEAMACGTPVLTSNTTSLPEVAGNAALLVDPLSVDEISEGIEQICTNNDLRETLQQKGLLQAAQYSWSKVVDKVGVVLKELENGR